MTTELTHILFDWETVEISPNLRKVFDFLMWIESEINTLLNHENQIKEIRGKFQIILNDFARITKILENNNIDFKLEITKETMTIVDDFEINQMARSQMIAIFAYMETIFCLLTIYDYEIVDERKIMEQTNHNMESLIKKYILTDQNKFYKLNKDRLSKITRKQLKTLRNRLTHFFWVSETIWIIPKWADHDARKIEKRLHKNKHNYIFMTPHDFYELLRYSIELILIKRNNESRNDTENFTKKIWYILRIVENEAPQLVKMKEIATN